MKYHFLRMLNYPREISRRLFEDNYICIGYSDLHNEGNGYDYMSYYLEQGENKEEVLKADVIDFFGKWGHNYKLEKFLNLEIGDIVLVPDSKCFYITRVVEKPISFPKIADRYTEKPVDVGFVCKVEKITNGNGDVVVNRERFAIGELKGKLRSLSGYFPLDSENTQEIINNFKNNKILRVEEELKENLKEKVLRVIMASLNPNNIERFVKRLMEKTGAVCEIPARNDKSNTETNIGDVDIICSYEKIKHIIYIQVKYHRGETGEWGVKQLEDYRDENLDSDYSTSYWLITTGEISEKTRKLVMENNKKTIRLIDGLELAQMVLELGIDDLEINN